jgi:2-methylcitrate dehydratase PrpD
MGRQIEDLARFVATTRWTDAPGAVQHRAKLVLLDTIGVILAGSARPEVRELRERLAGTFGTGATVLAHGLPASDPQTAAMLNAMAGRSIEMTEGLRGLQGAVHVIPGVLAVGEHRRSTGEGMLEAFLLGYEVGGRLLGGFTPHPLAHPNGQISLLSAVAAGARLHELDAGGVSLAMRIATTMLMTPSYMNTAAGGTTLNLPAGMGGLAATLAPQMALAGYHAQEDAIEEALGRMVGTGFDPAGVADGLGESWGIADNYFRFYACCNPIHPALDSLKDVLDELRPRPEEIDRIDIQTFEFASVMRNPNPPNYFASKYSLPHAAATLIIRGGLGFADLDDSALGDPAIAALRPRVHIVADPAMTAAGPALKPARVTVQLTDGRQASASCENSKRDVHRPDPEPQVRKKFRELAGTMLMPDGVARAEAAVDQAEHWTSIEDFLAILRDHARP